MNASAMPTGAAQSSAGQPPPPPFPPARGGRAGGVLLLIGGLLYAAGSALRWWGPVPDGTQRMDDSSNPLWAASTNIAPWSSELSAAGMGALTIGLLALVLLPWGRRRWLAALLLLTGVLHQGSMVVPWLADRLDLHAPDVSVPLWYLLMWPWAFGVSQGFLIWLAVTTATDHGLSVRRSAVAVFGLLGLTGIFIEYFLLMPFSMSHDDPVGFGVLSGVGCVAAGLLLLLPAILDRRSTRAP